MTLKKQVLDGLLGAAKTTYGAPLPIPFHIWCCPGRYDTNEKLPSKTDAMVV